MEGLTSRHQEYNYSWPATFAESTFSYTDPLCDDECPVVVSCHCHLRHSSRYLRHLPLLLSYEEAINRISLDLHTRVASNHTTYTHLRRQRYKILLQSGWDGCYSGRNVQCVSTRICTFCTFSCFAG